MVRVSSVSLLLIAIAVVLAVTSCSAGATHPGDPSPQPSVRNDPALEAAAASLRPRLEQSFADFFAGLELRHEIPLMIIYRRANPQLDAEVVRSAPDVRVTFRDAKYSLVEMKAATQQLLADAQHWRDQGMAIVAAGPAIDGSGLLVTTSGNDDQLAKALKDRFPTMSYIVREGTIAPPIYTGTPPVYSATPTT